MSIVWIGIISYIMVYCAAKIGCLLNVGSVFMGLTVLAAGTSLPDALGSIEAARKGKGDMAVANAIGSNVFDILIGLGFPWFLRGLIRQEPFPVLTDDVDIFIYILFSTVILTVMAFLGSNW